MSFWNSLLSTRGGCGIKTTYVPPVNVIYTKPTNYVTKACDCTGNCTITPIYQASGYCVQYGVFDGSTTSLAVGDKANFTKISGNGCDICLNASHVTLAPGNIYRLSISTVAELEAAGNVELNLLANGVIIGQLDATVAATTPTTITWDGILTVPESDCANWCNCCCATAIDLQNVGETAVTLDRATLSIEKLS